MRILFEAHPRSRVREGGPSGVGNAGKEKHTHATGTEGKIDTEGRHQQLAGRQAGRQEGIQACSWVGRQACRWICREVAGRWAGRQGEMEGWREAGRNRNAEAGTEGGRMEHHDCVMWFGTIIRF